MRRQTSNAKDLGPTIGIHEKIYACEPQIIDILSYPFFNGHAGDLVFEVQWKGAIRGFPAPKNTFGITFLSMILLQITWEIQRVYINSHFFVTLYGSTFSNAINQLSVFLECEHSGMSLHLVYACASKIGCLFHIFP